MEKNGSRLLDRKKGFTLVELLGVIALLGLLVLIVYPVVIEVIEKKQKEIGTTKEKLIYSAADTYVGDHPESFPHGEGKQYCIEIERLILENKIAVDVSDVKEQGVQVIMGKKQNTYRMVKTCNRSLNEPTYEVSETELTSNDVTVKIRYHGEGTKLFQTTIPVTSNTNVIPCFQEISGVYVCNAVGTTEVQPNIWYQAEEDPILTFKQNGSLVAQEVNGKNYVMGSTLTIGNIDKTPPIANLTIGTIKTNSVNVIATCSDNESGITKYEYSMDEGRNWILGTANGHTFTRLTNNTDYTFKARCTNGTGLTTEVSKSATTSDMTNPTIKQIRQIPSTGVWAQSREFRITYTNVQDSVYYFKSSVPATVGSGVVTGTCGSDTNPSVCNNETVTTLVANTWYRTTSATPSITYTLNGTLYAVMSDGVNISRTVTATVSNIDTTPPSIDVNVSNIHSDQLTLTANCIDNESGIAKYEFSKDSGKTWVNGGTTNTYTFTELKSDAYLFKIRCTNGSGLAEEIGYVSGTSIMLNPTIAQTSATIANGYTWATQRVIQINYKNENIINPTYYFKSTVAATVAKGVVTGTCGTGTNPGTCTNGSVTTLVANTWYKTNSINPSITYTSNGTVYAVTGDGTNLSGTAIYTVSKTSNGTPTTPGLLLGGGGSYHWNTSDVTLSLSAATSDHSSEASGIAKYQYYISTVEGSVSGGSWKDCPVSSSYPCTVTIQQEGRNYVYVRAIANNGKMSSISGAEHAFIDKNNPVIQYSILGGTYSVGQQITATAIDAGFHYMDIEIHIQETETSWRTVYKDTVAYPNASYTATFNTTGVWRVYTRAVDYSEKWNNQSPTYGDKWYYQEYIIR